MHIIDDRLKQPEDGNVKIWRYMNFTKFLSLLDTRSLHFSRVDRFDDPFEGSYPKKNISSRETEFKSLSNFQQESAKESSREIMMEWRKYVAVNCWHENEYESAAMWNLYLKSEEGIAIQSTFNSLSKSIIDEEDILIGRVNYIDYENEYIDPESIIEPYIHKRKSFVHEREIRALVFKVPSEGKPFSDEGKKISVDVGILVQKIFIAPNSPIWFLELVKSAVKKFGFNFDVKQSKMDESPLF